MTNAGWLIVTGSNIYHFRPMTHFKNQCTMLSSPAKMDPEAACRNDGSVKYRESALNT